MFNAPIPGESLTKPPRNYPWERPPEIVDPEEALVFYLDRIMKPETVVAIMDGLEVGMTIKAITSGLLRIGVSEGMHTIDVSLLIAPAIHETIKNLADELGIEYDEGFEDKEAQKESKEKIEYLKAKVRLKNLKKRKDFPTKETLSEQVEVQEELPLEEPQMGLMSRRK